MRIRKLYLKDIGPFDEVEFEFKPQEKGKAEIHILTGPNGSGKTTVLHALASVFSKSEDFVKPSANNAFIKRFRDIDAVGSQPRLLASFDKGDAVEIGVDDSVNEITQKRRRAFDLHKFNSNSSINEYRERTWPDTDFFVAAYSGYRKISHAAVNAIQELELDPFEDALIFDKGAKDNFTNNQWIANSISKRAIEKEKNNPEQANKFASSMVIMEKAISMIAGHEVKFDLKTSPLSLVLNANKADLDFDVLPDGLRSAIGWIGDLLMRLDLIKWHYDLPVNEQNIILFLDEIEVHLHPSWQRKILPVVQKLFPNAQIFLTTHSPFVVNSIDGAWVYELKLKKGKAYLDDEARLSKSGESYEHVLRDVFDIETRFGSEAQKGLDLFQQRKNEILQGETVDEAAFLKDAQHLATQSLELQSIIQFELRQLNRIKGKSYEL